MRKRPPDIRTLTPGERRRADLDRRRKRYFVMMGCCLLLVLLSFFGTALPTAVRLVLAGVAAVLAPVAAMVGNRNPF